MAMEGKRLSDIFELWQKSVLKTLNNQGEIRKKKKKMSQFW